MDKQNEQYDWDDQYYGTGPTQPPPSRGGLVALMLILIIFLCGIITVLGILNVRMFRQMKLQEKKQDLSISFTTEPTVPDHTAPTAAANEPAMVSEGEVFSSMQLQSSPQSIDNLPTEGGLPLQEIYSRNIASVVSITSTGYHGGKSTGTGVILSADGYIVTNAHVVEDGYAISVQLSDDRVLSAAVIGSDEISDLAVLQVQAEELIPAQFGDSSQLRVGDTVVAIGDPLGVKFRGTYTDGIVSAINRDVEMDGRVMTLIQTNAALNSGNSGGPLLNCYGQVIGINTMKIGDYMNSNGVEGLGFAIPTTTVQEIVNQLIAQGYVSGRPSLGITGESVPIAYQRFYGMPGGLYITGVEEDSAADEMGIEPGDILVSIDEVNITDGDVLSTALYAYKAGDKVELIVYRAGRYYSLELTLNEATG